MVSQRRKGAAPAPGSRERLIAAAAEEFAARGFDGAKVDRIAARARVNKAMVYYHFASKASLYREVLRGIFGAAAEAVEAARGRGRPPDEQLRAFIAALSHSAITRPHFPAMWLREVAEGGRHLDETVIAQMRRVMRTLGAILDEGRRTHVFREIHPLVAQIGIVAPLLVFAASAPIRRRFRGHVPAALTEIAPGAVVAHVQATTLASLVRGDRPHLRPGRPARRTRS